MKTRLVITLGLLLLMMTNGYSQILPPKLSIGALRSDVSLSGMYIYARKTANTPKIGFYTTLSSGYRFNNFLSVDLGIGYQERLPLETYRFGGFVMHGVPTSLQSKGWDADKHLRFPNFKYVHFEVLPTFTLNLARESRFKIMLGVGAFYGYMLNHRQQHFSRVDFPGYADAFEGYESIFPIGGRVEETVDYEKEDMGLIWKLSADYALSNRLSIGLSFKNYMSYTEIWASDAILENNVKLSRKNTTWTVYAAGIDFSYRLNKK